MGQHYPAAAHTNAEPDISATDRFTNRIAERERLTFTLSCGDVCFPDRLAFSQRIALKSRLFLRGARTLSSRSSADAEGSRNRSGRFHQTDDATGMVAFGKSGFLTLPRS